MSVLVVVTGGSGGLGAALLRTAPAGARLLDVSRSGPPDLEREVVHVPADLAEPRAWESVGRRLEEELAGRWDRVVLWHAAGTIAPIGFAGEVDQAAYTRNVLLNAACGPVLGASFLAALARSGAARRELALVSSGAARRAYPGWSAYGAGKAALDQWARAVAAEQAERGGVRVVSVAPGVVATGMQRQLRATDARDFPRVRRFRELHEHDRLEDPGEVATRLWRLLDEPGLEPVVDLRDR